MEERVCALAASLYMYLGEEGYAWRALFLRYKNSVSSSAETKQLYAVLDRGLSEHGTVTPFAIKTTYASCGNYLNKGHTPALLEDCLGKRFGFLQCGVRHYYLHLVFMFCTIL